MTGTVGVLALQGSYNEHLAGKFRESLRGIILHAPYADIFSAVLRRLGVRGVQVKKPEQLEDVGALIIPGGESTTMAKLAEYHNLVCIVPPLVFTTTFRFLVVQEKGTVCLYRSFAVSGAARLCQDGKASLGHLRRANLPGEQGRW